MATLDQKINTFIEQNFPDIDYSVLGSGNQDKGEQKMGLNYEYFVNSIEYYLFQKNIDTEEIKQLSTGDMRGIDGCFFILNKQLFIVPDWSVGSDIFDEWKNDFDEAIKKCAEIELDFHFLQSKSSKTELVRLNGFCDAVYDIFSIEANDLSSNLKVITLKYVYSESCNKKNKINLFLRYCSINKDSKQIGSLLEKDDWKSAIIKNKRNLRSNKFEEVNIEIKSGQDYQDKLEAILSPNQRTYPIENLTTKFAEIKDGDALCYIGYLNLFEVKLLIENDDKDLDDIFFDNIRYFGGLGEEGSVNKRIYKSLEQNSSIFHLLHNGITITAHSKHYNQAKEIFEIKSFSVINGCQTCNLIWLWIKEHELKVSEEISNSEEGKTISVETKLNLFYEGLKNIKVPVKIVITSDPNLRAKITEAANTQNEVDSIQLVAISEEAKSLQNLFETEIRIGEKIYYERLSRQFPNIGKSFKLSTEDVFRAFYSTFKKSPHKLTVGYGKFEKEKLKSKDFLSSKKSGESLYDINTYYSSSILFNYLERYLRSQYVSLISLKHHILLLLCISIDKEFEKLNPENKLKLDFIEQTKKLISDKTSFNKRIDEICKIAIDNFDFLIDNSGSKPKVKPKSYYSEEGTEKMIKIFKEKYSTYASN